MPNTEFNEEQLRYDLIDSTGKELKSISKKTASKIAGQLDLIEDCSKSFESVTENLSIIDNSVSKINTTFSNVSKDAKKNAHRLGVVTEAMEKLEEDFDKVASLIKMINGIADQTNLLALNATIEAARAGEHGKGFAVVASEVKELSKTTKQANEGIQTTLTQISSSIKSLSEQVSSTTNTISDSLFNVENSTKEIKAITSETQNFGRVIEENLFSFQNLANQAIEMGTQLSELTTIGDTFTYLLEMMNISGLFEGASNPIDRLKPHIESSTYFNDKRFSSIYEKEVILTSDDILISATDKRGVITFANKRFCDVAGYPSIQLIGKPHNVIRHPDMPKLAFTDLWQVMKEGKLWCGIVKNATKSRGFYWVKAIVFPCYKDNEIIGYLSVRKKATPLEISTATEAYKKLE